MIRRFCRLIAALLTVMLLAGCGTSFYDPKSTMRSPRPTGDMENLLKALESAAGKDIVLKYPDSAGTRSAFLLHDLDGDGVEEALAFYQKRAEGALTRVNLIRNVSGVWRSVQDLDPIGSELLSVDFGDLNGDGIDEVITGWSVYNTKENQMCVYQQRNGRLVQRANETYTQYVVCDIDNCGSDEVAIIQLNTTAKTAMMNFLRFENDQMTVKGTVQLDGNVTGYMKVKCAPLNNSNMGIFIDAYKGAQGLITELVTYENSMMVNKFFDIQKQETTQTMRYLMMASSDINRDGYIEIPFATELPGYPSSAPEKKEYLITWQSYDGQGRFPLAFRAWYCPDDYYYLQFDQRWSNSATVLRIPDQRLSIFYEWNSSTGTSGDELLRIKTFRSGEWEQSAPSDYAVITQTEDLVYAARISGSTSKNAITAQQLVEYFHLIKTV